MATTVFLDWDVIQYNDPADDKTTLRKLYKIKDPGKILEKLDKIASNLPANTDGERSGKAIIESICRNIKSLCSNPEEGSNFSQPPPKQHILRIKTERISTVCNNNVNWSFNGFPISYEGSDRRKKFFWSHIDLLGLFFTKLGPAPPAADKYNFFLPLTAVYARWSRCLVRKTLSPPTIFQCTWTDPEPGRGKLIEFSLGASLAGFHVSLVENLRVTRFDMLSEFPGVKVPIETSEGRVMPWKFENTLEKFWKFGNCAEIYPFFQLLSEMDGNTRTYGVAMKFGAVDDVEKQDGTKSLAYYEDKMLERVERKDDNGNPMGVYEFRNLIPPCANCTHLLVKVIDRANLSQFLPIYQFRGPVDFQKPSDEPPDD
ncbi:hypothetical protein F4806DRAFT_443642 [Annulohypoxylon nitens]|nr:hypothetical protein F4806DRAFT_443642 [Annulohypoxylon nitens]